MTYRLKCENCGHYNPVRSEYLVFCEKCNKKLPNHFKEWEKQNPGKSLDDFKNEIGTTDEELANLRKTQQKKSKRLSSRQIAGIIVGIIAFGVSAYFTKGILYTFFENRQIKKIAQTQFQPADTSNWKTFSPKGFGFEVLFPGQPTENTQEVETEIGPLKITQFLYQPKVGKDDNLAYGAAYTEYPIGAVNSPSMNQMELDAFFKNAIDGLVANVNGKLVSATIINYGDYPGREVLVDFQNGLATIKARVYLIENKMNMMQVITPAQNHPNRVADKFLESFRLVGEQ